MGANLGVKLAASEDAKNLILQRYNERIGYYQKSARFNKRWYKVTRCLLIILGALVTLVASLQSASFVKGRDALSTIFAIGTPLLAAALAIAGGISQAFQWGAAWSDMVITATRLEKERDRIMVTSTDQIDPVKEMQALDDVVLAETQGFFQRMLGSGGPSKSDNPQSGA